MIAKLEVKPFGSNEKLYNKLAYSIMKMEQGKCVFLYDSSFLNNVNLLYDEMKKVGDLSDRTKLKYNEVSISLPPGEHLNDEKFREMAIAYMERLGYGESCYNVWRHSDKDHEHVHILFTTVDYQGRWIDDFESKRRSQKISRELEQEFGLQQVVYNRFNNEPLSQVKAREYYFDNALKKGLRGYNSKAELKAVIGEELSEKILGNKYDNETLQGILGEELYNRVGGILEKHKLFKTLYKSELIGILDSIYDISLSRNDFIQRIRAAGVYVRMLTYKGKSEYCYGLPEVNMYFHDRQLPLRFRFDSLLKFRGKQETAELMESEQKHRVYNRVFLALKNSKNFDGFKLELKKLGVTLLEYKNSGGVYGIGFKLDIANAVDFKASEISRRLSYGKLKEYFSGENQSLITLVNEKPEFIQNLMEDELAGGLGEKEERRGSILHSAVVSHLMGTGGSDKDEQDESDDFLKKKKKKRKDREHDI